MDDSLYYLAINRQRGLKAEMATIGNNIANLDTPGYRREGTMFAEFILSAPGGDSLSMADLSARYASSVPGAQSVTGAMLDLAIEGEGFFAVERAEGMMLTRAGAFQRSADGLLVTADGDPVLDAAEAPIFLPPEGEVAIGADGTISIGGEPQGQIGVFDAPPEALRRAGGTGFVLEDERDILALAQPKLRQGALEGSNVSPVGEIARLIEVSRAYEQAQMLIEDEDERIREAISTLGRPV